MGRRGKAKEVAEDPKESVEEAKETPATEAKSSTRRGRGKAAVEDNLEDTITKQPPKARTAVAKVVEEEAKEATPVKKTGRGKRKAEPEIVEEVAKEVEEVKPAAKRGRRGAKVVEEEVKEAPAAAAAKKPAGRRGKVQDEVAEVVEEVVKPKRGGRKPAAAAAEVVAEEKTETPVKKGR